MEFSNDLEMNKSNWRRGFASLLPVLQLGILNVGIRLEGEKYF
jgi:hypothetical protein